MSDLVLTRLMSSLSERYRIDREIGQGGIATVYLAHDLKHDLKHDRDVAIKVLKPELGVVLGVERFLSEIKVTANLQHPNLLPLFESGQVEGLLGTPQYMSPEQAIGDRTVDARTDVYSLGAMTYEMLTGEPPHSGATAQAIIAKLMTEAVRPLTVLRRSVPAQVDAAVRHALEKLAADRFATAGEYAQALQGKGDPATLARYLPAASGAGAGAPAARRGRMLREAAAWAVAALGIAAFVWVRLHPMAVPDTPVIRGQLEPPAGELVMVGGFPIAISPQVDKLAYVTSSVTILIGTNDGLFQVPTDGGTVTLLTDKTAANGAVDPVLLSDGKTVLVHSAQSGTLAYRHGARYYTSRSVLAGGGSDAVLREEPASYETPRFSPDGRNIAVAISTKGGTDIWIQDRAGNTFTRLTTAGVNRAPEWSPDGKRVIYTSISDGNNRTKGIDYRGTPILSAPVDGSAKADTRFVADAEAVVVHNWRRELRETLQQEKR